MATISNKTIKPEQITSLWLNHDRVLILFLVTAAIMIISFSLFKVSSDDIFIYLTVAKEAISNGRFPTYDPYLLICHCYLKETAISVDMNHEIKDYTSLTGWTCVPHV